MKGNSLIGGVLVALSAFVGVVLAGIIGQVLHIAPADALGTVVFVVAVAGSVTASVVAAEMLDA
jgi:hypothetical protein